MMQNVYDEEADLAKRPGFYSDAESYWSGIPATVDGMLGGYGHISSTDIDGSMDFLKNFLKKDSSTGTSSKCALDCGAGIGRITKRLLLPLFDIVDLVEVNPKFLEEAKTFLSEHSERVGNYFCSGLQNFNPEPGRYDVIWVQWVVGHLTDKDLAEFFRRCLNGLAENGLIVVKDNVSSGSRLFDEQDSSYTRNRQQLENVFQNAGLKVLKHQKQKHFPKGLYDVHIYALQSA